MQPITNIHDLDFSKTYTYADYVTWHLHDRVELIIGKIFRMSPASDASHQLISAALTSSIHQFQGEMCRVFAAPFDVRLPTLGAALDNTENVVQPDICVICDPTKVDARGCKGAPDLVVEIVSKASVGKDLHEKFNLYEQSGVKEYWIIHPYEKTLSINVLGDDGVYHTHRLLTKGDVAVSKTLPGLSIDLTEIFQELIEEPEMEYESEIRRT